MDKTTIRQPQVTIGGNFRGFSGDAQWLALFLLTLYMWIGIIPTECR